MTMIDIAIVPRSLVGSHKTCVSNLRFVAQRSKAIKKKEKKAFCGNCELA